MGGIFVVLACFAELHFQVRCVDLVQCISVYKEVGTTCGLAHKHEWMHQRQHTRRTITVDVDCIRRTMIGDETDDVDDRPDRMCDGE